MVPSLFLQKSYDKLPGKELNLMIDFQRPTQTQHEPYNNLLFSGPERGCEYSFANLFLWGHQKIAFLHGCAVIFSHFHGKSVYPYPVGTGDKKAAVEAILRDAEERGIPCRITGITNADRAELEHHFPGIFLICSNRDSFDYVYDINDLADLRGRKFQSKRNHFNRFCSEHPNHQVIPISSDILPRIREFVDGWFDRRRAADPQGDYMLETLAMARAFNHWEELNMEGIVLMDNHEILAMTMGSRLSPDTFDVHFEKAHEAVSGAYMAINCHFARYLRLKYPDTKYMQQRILKY